MTLLDLRVLTWVRASADDVRRGLLGYLTIEYGDLLIDGITLRRTADARFTLSFPARTDRAGRRHAYVRPVDDEARRQIETIILGELESREEAS